MSHTSKLPDLSRARVLARNLLLTLGVHVAARRYHLNAGLVSAIRAGRRQASRRVLAVLGIEFVETGPAPICRVHGIAHGKQCRPRKTFEQNAREYADWLKCNAHKIAKLASQ